MGGTVLVTGGAGFIGSMTCRHLAEAGWSPVAFDNLSTGHADALGGLPLVVGDTRDAGAVEAALRAHGAGAIVHFAAKAHVGESVERPADYGDNNVGGMIGLLQGARAAGVGQVVLSSTCATYGISERLPIREDDPQRPINPYGRTKLACEQMLRDVGAAHGLRHVSLRHFNAAGADPLGRMGERHEPETHLIPLALRAASGQGPALRIFGTDYATPDGTCLRDYVHVHDLARAHVLALRHLEDGGESLALDLGSRHRRGHRAALGPPRAGRGGGAAAGRSAGADRRPRARGPKAGLPHRAVGHRDDPAPRRPLVRAGAAA